MHDFRWILDVVQNVDVGLVLLDKEYKIQLWNSFMQNHSVTTAEEVIGRSIFESFPEIDEVWFKRKAESVYLLKNSAFTTWEQRPFLFRFENYRPITSKAEFMYQNTTFIPIQNVNGKTDGICLIVYDVTEQAVNHLALETANQQLEVMSKIDGLTSLFNRKTWEQMFEREYHRLCRYDEECTVIIFDIDHFKKVNDNYGHPAGDEVIRQTARILSDSLRKTDVAGRYGGEEYIIYLPHTNVDSAHVFAERIRKKIASQPAFYEGEEINYTISLGLSGFSKTLVSPTAWIDTADQALYQSKEGGRNLSNIYQHKED